MKIYKFTVSCLQKIQFVPKSPDQFLKLTSFLFDSLENYIGSKLLKSKNTTASHVLRKKKVTENFASIFMTWWENQNLKLQGQMYFPGTLNYCTFDGSRGIRMLELSDCWVFIM